MTRSMFGITCRRGQFIRSAALATLVACAASVAGCDRAGTPAAAPTDGAGLAGPLATLTALAGGGSASSDAVAAQSTPGAAADQLTAYRQTQEAVNAAAEIAPIRPFVKQQTPLATFTPDASAPTPSGAILYVRSGLLQRASAEGGTPEAVVMENEMPAIWAPPEDPGRAWASPDGRWVAMMVGSDAALWVSRPDGSDNRAVSGSNLPTNLHDVSLSGDRTQSVRLMPGKDYTLVITPGGPEPFGVLVDDNSRHIRGEGRVRVVHAADAARESKIEVSLNGSVAAKAVSYGRSTGEQRVPAGQVVLEVRDEKGRDLLPASALELGERELVTVFLHGRDAMQATQTRYEPGTMPESGHSRVRVFASGDRAADVAADGELALASGLAAGELGPYVQVPAVGTEDDLREQQQIVYGLRAREQPVVWSPDSRSIAFLGAADGHVDLYVTDSDGNVSRVTDDPNLELNPVWSPDSRGLAWVSADEEFGQQSLVYRREGSDPAAADLSGLVTAAGWEPTATVTFRFGAGWADNDRVFVYPSSAGVDAGIWLLDTRSGALAPAFQEQLDDPAWSPAARSWAFAQDEGRIQVLPLDGEPRVVATGEVHAPDWSPDGSRLSYTEGETMSPNGWRLHSVKPDGSGETLLTDWLPLVQQESPAPGPRAKRTWVSDGRDIVFSLVGTDYGAAEEAGPMGQVEAGNDLENLWIVPAAGGAPPRQLTDLMRVYYIKDVTQSPSGDSLGFVAFSYLSRSQQLWAVPLTGGKPASIDGPVRWFMWPDK